MSTIATRNVLPELTERGLVHTSTHGLLGGKQHTVYTGFDPTADSLHVGNLLALVTLARFQLHGHKPIALIGGATGLIGDPSGKSTERPNLPLETAANNAGKIHEQIKLVFGNIQRVVNEETREQVQLLNNADWLSGVKLIDFLMNAGKFMRLNEMLSRESVRARLRTRNGISFTEFSYQAFQAYDYYHLHQNHGCTLQIGGSDQWGNILAGIDLIHRKNASVAAAHGLVYPLLTTKTGQKFGKSEGNAVWLDSSKTTCFDFYQFFLRAEDDQVEKLLKQLTFLPIAEIMAIMAEHQTKSHEHLAQRKLAEHMTRIVHGDEGLEKAVRATKLLYGESLSNYSAQEVLDAFGNDPRLVRINAEASTGRLLDIVFNSLESVFKSKGKLKTIIKQGGFYLNNHRTTKLDQEITDADYLDGRVLFIRSGKAEYHLFVRE